MWVAIGTAIGVALAAWVLNVMPGPPRDMNSVMVGFIAGAILFGGGAAGFAVANWLRRLSR